MKLVRCGSAQNRANKQRCYDGKDYSHDYAPRSEQREPEPTTQNNNQRRGWSRVSDAHDAFAPGVRE
jgi:hypothetical protein